MDEVRRSYPTVKSLFDAFPSLFGIKRDGIDEFGVEDWIPNGWICQKYIDAVIAWREMVEPILRHYEAKARQYELQRSTSVLNKEDLDPTIPDKSLLRVLSERPSRLSPTTARKEE